MKPSVSISKITPPYLSKVLKRPRLIDLLENNKDKKLILILGQAAQGKSTLIASYLENGAIPAAWVNLDPDDSEAVHFFNLLSQSLQHALQEVDLSKYVPYPIEIVDRGLSTAHYQDWAQSIFVSSSDPLWIVLDNLDRLPSDASALSLLQILIESSPSRVHWILISRGFPAGSVEFQRLKITREAVVITNQDLAFTPEEIKAYFKKTRKLSLKREQTLKIFNATEGWIGGLVLLSEMMNRYPEPSVEEFIAKHLPNHFNSEVFQYFGREILSAQPREVQRFLVRASILDLIEPVFTDELFETENTGEVLRDHVRKNLFVESFYEEEKGWVFRFHNLFRNFLKAKFKTTVGKEERRCLYFKAAELYERRNEFEQAVKFYLEAMAYPRVVAIIERHGMDLLRSGKRSLLTKWISRLPEETFRDNPWFLFLQPMLGHDQVDREGLDHLNRARQLFKQLGNVWGQMISLAQMIVVSVSTGTHLVPVESLIEEGERLLQSMERNVHPYEEAILSYCLGAGYILGPGDVRKGITLCRNGYLLSKRLGDLHLQISALNFEALGYIFVGEFPSAQKILLLAELMLKKKAHPELKTIHLIIRCILANRQGQFQESRFLLDTLETEIERYGFIRLRPWMFEISIYLELVQGKLSEAEKLAKEYLNLTLSLKNNFLKGLSLRLLGYILFCQSRFKKAKEFVDEAHEIFSKEAFFEYELNRVRLLKALVDSRLKDDEENEKRGEKALAYFNSILDYVSIAEAHFILSLLKFKKRKEKAILHLKKGFEIAQEKKINYFRILGYPLFTQICLKALACEVHEAMDSVAHLLSAHLSGWAEKGLGELLNHQNPRVREKAREILRRIHRDRIPRLSIEALGDLKVYRGNSLIQEREWSRKQPRQLLMALIAHRGNKVAKESLLEDLWSDEPSEAAEKNFKTTLQRLRKSLEPVIHREFGSSYIHLHEGYVFLDSELCEVDVNRFISLIKQGDAEEKRGDIKKALSAYEAAASLYRGDFLPEEHLLSVVDIKREELRSAYLDLLTKMARLFEKQGALKKAIECHKRAIQTDPLLEESYQKLITFYANKGMYNEALKTYEECKKALKKGLKSKPDSVTNALYEKVFEQLNRI